MRSSFPALALATILLVAGTVQAAALRGQLDEVERLRVDGALEVVADAGALDLGRAVRLRQGVDVAWRAAHGIMVTREFVGTGPGRNVQPTDPAIETLAFGEGRIVAPECTLDCRALVFVAAPGAGRLAMSGAARDDVTLADDAYRYLAGMADGRSDSFRYDVPPGWTLVGGSDAFPDAMAVERAVATGTGRLGLFLYGVGGTIRSAEGSWGFWTGNRSGPVDGPLGLAGVQQGQRRYVILELEDAVVATRPGAQATLAAPAPALRVEGALRLAGAKGWLDLDERRTRLNGEDVDLSGSLVARMGQDVALQGEASSAVLRSVDLARSGTPGIGALTVAALAVLAFAALRQAGLLASYSRIATSDVLANANRRRIYEEVCHRPGSSIADLARCAGVSEPVASYHVRTLRSRNLVRAQAAGRALLCYPVDGALDAQRVGARATLSGRTGGSLGSLLLSSPEGLTQKEIAERSGVSQRLVSYHLARFRGAGLVTTEGERPARYKPSALLGETLPPQERAGRP